MKSQDSEMTECAKFHRQPGQSIHEFILTLQKPAGKCFYGAQLETQLRDCLVADIADEEVQAKLLIKPSPKCTTAKTICNRHKDVLSATIKTKDCL